MSEINYRGTYMRVGDPGFTRGVFEIVLSSGQRVGGTAYRDAVRVEVLYSANDGAGEADEPPSQEAAAADVREKAVRLLQQALDELRKWTPPSR